MIGCDSVTGMSMNRGRIVEEIDDIWNDQNPSYVGDGRWLEECEVNPDCEGDRRDESHNHSAEGQIVDEIIEEWVEEYIQ